MSWLRGLMHNEVETGVGLYADLEPLRVPRDPDTVFTEIEAYAREQQGWRDFRLDPEARELRCECVTRIFRWVDDLRVWVEADGDGALVRAHSKSRVGKGDLGANAKRIRALFESLAQ